MTQTAKFSTTSETAVSQEVRNTRDVLVTFHKQRKNDVDWIIDKSGVVICIFDDPSGMTRQTIEQQIRSAEVTN